MSAHTPGPWTIRHETNVFGGTRLVANAGGHQSNANRLDVDAENQANARLIAAAPELLDALSWAITYGDFNVAEDNPLHARALDHALALVRNLNPAKVTP